MKQEAPRLWFRVWFTSHFFGIIICISVYEGVVSLINELIEKVKAAEEAAQNAQVLAKEQRDSLISNTKDQIRQLIDDAQDDNIKGKKSLISQVEEENKKILQKEIEQASKLASDLRQKTTQKMDQVAQIVCDKVLS